MAIDEVGHKAGGLATKVTPSSDSPLPEEIEAEEGEAAQVIDHRAERVLCWKFDSRILPVLAFMSVPLVSQSRANNTDNL